MNDKIFNEINGASVANQLYGAKKKYKWPGIQITNLNDYNNTCYGIVSRFAKDQTDVNEIRYSPAGLMCQQGILDQIKLYGRNTCEKYISPPVTKLTPQNFKNAYIQTGDINKAYEICLKKATNSDEVKHCKLDKMALENTLNNKKVNVPKLFPDCDNSLIESFTSLEQSNNENSCGCDILSIVIWSLLGLFIILMVIKIIRTK